MVGSQETWLLITLGKVQPIIHLPGLLSCYDTDASSYSIDVNQSGSVETKLKRKMQTVHIEAPLPKRS